MYRVAAGIFCTLMLVAQSASAATTGAIPGNGGIDGKSDCPAGSDRNPSTVQPFPTTGDAALKTRIQRFLTTIEKCASACYDETIDIGLASSELTFTVTAKNTCGSGTDPSKVTPPRGCAAGQSQPQMTVTTQGYKLPLIGTVIIPSIKKGPISRCYGGGTETVLGVYNGTFGTNNNDPGVITRAFDNLNKFNTQAPTSAAPDSSAPTTIDASKLPGLLESSGIPATDAQKIIEKGGSGNVSKLLDAYKSNDQTAIKSAVEAAAQQAGVTLPESFRSQTTIVPPPGGDPRPEAPPNAPPNTPANPDPNPHPGTPDTTFRPGPGQQQPQIASSDVFNQIIRALGSFAQGFLSGLVNLLFRQSGQSPYQTNPYTNPYANPYFNPYTNPSANPYGNPYTQTQQTAPTLSLIVSPQSVARGDAMTVSWSAVGVREDTPCTVFADDQAIAQGNGGSHTITTSSTTPIGTTPFALRCVAQGNGAPVQQSVSVTVY